jgi:hypothetical protein
MSVSNNIIPLDEKLIREKEGDFIGGEKKRNNIIGLKRNSIDTHSTR